MSSLIMIKLPETPLPSLPRVDSPPQYPKMVVVLLSCPSTNPQKDNTAPQPKLRGSTWFLLLGCSERLIRMLIRRLFKDAAYKEPYKDACTSSREVRIRATLFFCGLFQHWNPSPPKKGFSEQILGDLRRSLPRSPKNRAPHGRASVSGASRGAGGPARPASPAAGAKAPPKHLARATPRDGSSLGCRKKNTPARSLTFCWLKRTYEGNQKAESLKIQPNSGREKGPLHGNDHEGTPPKKGDVPPKLSKNYADAWLVGGKVWMGCQ